MRISDIMSSTVACGTRNSSLREIAALMTKHECGEIPVCDDAHRPIGVVTDRDIVCRLVAQGKNPLELTAADCMSQPAITATPEMAIEDCARLMEQYHIPRLPVVDVCGACCGIVAQADLATKAPPHMTAEVVSSVSQPTATASTGATA